MSGRYRAANSYAAYEGELRASPRERARGYERPAAQRRVSPTRLRRSHAAVPVAVAVLLLGLYLGRFSILVPAGLGLLLLYTGAAFLSSRLNPFSIGFYLTVKPSWTAIGVLFLLGLLLMIAAYGFYASGVGPIVPGIGHLP